MTREQLANAQAVQKNIQRLEDTLYALKRIKILQSRGAPHLKFVNMLKRKDNKEVREAAALLFDGVNVYGTEIQVDESLLDCLKEHYSKRLEEAKAVLEAM